SAGRDCRLHLHHRPQPHRRHRADVDPGRPRPGPGDRGDRPMRRIDAHQHFWRYDRREYGWIDDGMRPLQRDFLPADLKPELDGLDFDGCIAVQARQTLEETRWLLE